MEELYILAEFQKEFNQPQVETITQFYKLIGVNTTMRNWYNQLKQSYTTEKGMPAAYKEAGFTAFDWDKYKADRAIIKKASKAYDEGLKEAVSTYKQKLATLDEARAKEFNKVSWFVKISRITVNELPEQDQVDLVLVTDDEVRSELQAEKVKNYQIKLLKEWKDTGKLSYDPFL
jgi:CRISPR/Cas system CMR-associated protein Cmr5 small subunit